MPSLSEEVFNRTAQRGEPEAPPDRTTQISSLSFSIQQKENYFLRNNFDIQPRILFKSQQNA